MVFHYYYDVCIVLMRAGEVDARHIMDPVPAVGASDAPGRAPRRRTLEWLRAQVGAYIEDRREEKRWTTTREEWGTREKKSPRVELQSRVPHAEV